jgi:phosphotriesterase-related protein
MVTQGLVPTVRGPVAADRLGPTLMHEHMLVDLTPGISQSRREAAERAGRWNSLITLQNLDDVRRNYDDYGDNLRLLDPEEAVAEIAYFKDAGGGCIVDATSPGIGRDPVRLRAISEAAGVHIVMGCGFYTAPYHPADAGRRDEEDLAREMIDDLTRGREGIVAGLIGEIGLSWPTHPNELKALRAAAMAQKATGAPISIHPGRDPKGPMQALEVVFGAGADPERTIIDHVDGRFAGIEEYEEVARTGCYLEIDLFGFESSYLPTNPGFDMPNDAARVKVVRELIDRGYGERILVSSDMAMKYHRKRYGGFGYDHILRQVVPLMLRRGIERNQVDDILVHNPARVLARPSPVV